MVQLPTDLLLVNVLCQVMCWASFIKLKWYSTRRAEYPSFMGTQSFKQAGQASKNVDLLLLYLNRVSDFVVNFFRLSKIKISGVGELTTDIHRGMRCKVDLRHHKTQTCITEAILDMQTINNHNRYWFPMCCKATIRFTYFQYQLYMADLFACHNNSCMIYGILCLSLDWRTFFLLPLKNFFPTSQPIFESLSSYLGSYRIHLTWVLAGLLHFNASKTDHELLTTSSIDFWLYNIWYLHFSLLQWLLENSWSFCLAECVLLYDIAKSDRTYI